MGSGDAVWAFLAELSRSATPHAAAPAVSAAPAHHVPPVGVRGVETGCVVVRGRRVPRSRVAGVEV